MVADIFELNGWRGYFLGANLPVDAVKSFIEEKQPDVVALSVATIFNLDQLLRVAADLRSTFAAVPMLVGGQAFRWIERAHVERLPGVRCLKNFSELETWIHNENGKAIV